MLSIETSGTLGSLLEEGFFLGGMSETFSSTSKSKFDSSSDSEGSGAFLFLEIGVLFGLEILPTNFTLPFPLEVPAFLSFSDFSPALLSDLEFSFTSLVAFSLEGL